MLPVREVFQDGFGIVADRSKLEALFSEPGFRALQLDQLPFTVRSPVRRAEEEKNCAIDRLERMQILAPAKLIP